MKNILVALSLSVALITPVCLQAQDHHDDKGYYDKHHKDYHHWDDNEDKAWRIYLEQQHHAYYDWNRANARQQQAYWDWRHNHSDAVLQINVH